jgi:hypothetical protein
VDIEAPMAVRWDGSRWHRLAVRLPTGAARGTLASVSCKPGGCLAVGVYFTPPNGGVFALAEYWNDSTWTPVTLAFPPGPRDQSLGAVSCVTASHCVAVGTQYAGVPTGFGQLLDGAHWAEPAMPWPRGTRSSLYGVSCAGKTCLAVGEAESLAANGTASQPAALTWNGATWTQQATPRGTIGTLYGVTCVTAADCVAVGNAGTHDLSGFWNGTAWTIVNPT